MKNLQTPVITSKAANEDFDKIKVQFGDVMKGIQDQATRVLSYKQNMQVERKEKEIADTANQKDAAANDIKTKELEIKRAALTL